MKCSNLEVYVSGYVLSYIIKLLCLLVNFIKKYFVLFVFKSPLIESHVSPHVMEIH